MNHGDIVVVLTPRWHEPDWIVQQQSNGPNIPMIKVDSYAPFSSSSGSSPRKCPGRNIDSNPVRTKPVPVNVANRNSNQTHSHTPYRAHSRSNSQIRSYKARDDSASMPSGVASGAPSKRKSPFSLKLFHITSASGDEDPSGSNPSPYGHNAQYSDAEEEHHEMIPIKLRDFQKYITMQATCTAV